MKRKITIEYNYKELKNGPDFDVTEYLEEEAQRHIIEMWTKGCTSGDLHCFVDGNEVEYHYSGYFSIQQEDL